jgi:hypothetical protein
MGLLDDAIREHLDLKRRRGADPSEIERAERDELAPPEADADYPEFDAVAPESEAALTAEPWEPFQQDPELRALEEDEELPPYEPARGPDADPLTDEDPFSGETAGTLPPHPADEEPVSEVESVPAPHPADPPRRQARHDEPSKHVDQETEEYELEPEEGADDDVLESTPEFLQDAPEHDRLWFEQRPPRDFDFDG